MRHDPSVYAGSFGGYAWLSAVDYDFVSPDLIKRSHLGLRLAITCFDSGSITPTAEEQSIGWSVQGRAMVSPPLTEAIDIPMDQFDEWYILETPRLEDSVVEPFVNYGGFTLVAPEVLAQDQGSRPDTYEFLRPLQERFWRQLLALKPETFVGWGDVTVVVSRRPDFVRAVHAA
jgi:hypothetical protein